MPTTTKASLHLIQEARQFPWHRFLVAQYTSSSGSMCLLPSRIGSWTQMAKASLLKIPQFILVSNTSYLQKMLPKVDNKARLEVRVRVLSLRPLRVCRRCRRITIPRDKMGDLSSRHKPQGLQVIFKSILGPLIWVPFQSLEDHIHTTEMLALRRLPSYRSNFFSKVTLRQLKLFRKSSKTHVEKLLEWVRQCEHGRTILRLEVMLLTSMS